MHILSVNHFNHVNASKRYVGAVAVLLMDKMLQRSSNTIDNGVIHEIGYSFTDLSAGSWISAISPPKNHSTEIDYVDRFIYFLFQIAQKPVSAYLLLLLLPVRTVRNEVNIVKCARNSNIWRTVLDFSWNINIVMLPFQNQFQLFRLHSANANVNHPNGRTDHCG